MKKVGLIISLMAIMLLQGGVLMAQNEAPEKGFGGAKFFWTQFADETAFVAGGHGAKFLSKHFFLGGEGYGFEVDIEETNMEYSLGYGGLLGGYVFKPEANLQLSTMLMVGVGGITEQDRTTFAEKEEFLMVMRPTLELDYAVTGWFRPGLVVSYRRVIGGSSLALSNTNLSGLSGGVSFKFGNFFPDK